MSYRHNFLVVLRQEVSDFVLKFQMLRHSFFNFRATFSDNTDMFYSDISQILVQVCVKPEDRISASIALSNDCLDHFANPFISYKRVWMEIND